VLIVIISPTSRSTGGTGLVGRTSALSAPSELEPLLRAGGRSSGGCCSPESAGSAGNTGRAPAARALDTALVFTGITSPGRPSGGWSARAPRKSGGNLSSNFRAACDEAAVGDVVGSASADGLAGAVAALAEVGGESSESASSD